MGDAARVFAVFQPGAEFLGCVAGQFADRENVGRADIVDGVGYFGVFRRS
jgi:hypothetical protein